ncbi:MAG: hypothetical protein O7A63_10785 [Acidobacteria bacterium]|nr:hypothetical protein [Acidobacteriota bacterium]
MRIAPSFALITGTLVLLLAQPAPQQTVPFHARSGSHPATVEPLPPVVIDLQFLHLTRTPPGWQGVVRIEIIGDDVPRDVSMRLLLPDGVDAGSGTWLTEIGRFRLVPGVPRRYVIPLSLPGDGAYAIQVEAIVELDDGTSLKTRQGRTLHAGRYRGEGRYRLGAYEVMGVPVEELEP